MAEVITLGEALVVLYPPTPEPLVTAPHLTVAIGGAEVNCALALRSLGHTVRFVGRVGADAGGERVRATLAAARVAADTLRADPDGPTGLYLREWLADGQRRGTYYRQGSAGSRLAPADLVARDFRGARLLHLTGITPALSASAAATVARAITLARAANCALALDLNYRAALWSPADAARVLAPLCSQVDILLLGHEDALAVLGAEEETALAQASRLGAPIVVLKCAERGADLWTQGQTWHVAATPVAQVIDPVGAGDAFDAGFLAGWLRGWNWDDALALGARLGAQAVATIGDHLPVTTGSVEHPTIK